MAGSESVVILNDFSGVKVQERTRTSGKKQTTLSIAYKGDAVATNLDAQVLAKMGVDALVAAVQSQIQRISFQAAPATIKKRQSQARAYAAGKTWAQKQFAGGRIGAMPPYQSDRLFNNSGRLARGITANWSPQQHAWIIRFPANRFAPEFVARAPQVLQRLIDLVPAIRSPLSERAVVDAIWGAPKRATAVVNASNSSAAARAGIQVIGKGIEILAKVVEAIVS